MTKPRIFIGSSSESIKITNACNVALDHVAEVTPWTFAFDKAGSDTLSALITKSENVDFALFVFSPDDIVTMRGESQSSVRDNVLFELGLFIGAIGKDRCFILRPRNEELYIATDLAGINTYDFDPVREDKNMNNAVNAACVRLSGQMEETGRITKTPSSPDKVLTANVTSKEYTLKDSHLRMLAELVSTHTRNVEGMYFWDLENKGLPYSEPKLHMGLIQLMRSGYIEKLIVDHEHGGSDYAYKITNNGIEYLLDNEDRLDEIERMERQQNYGGFQQQAPQRGFQQQAPQGGFGQQTSKLEESDF